MFSSLWEMLTKTPHEKLIEWLENQGFTEQAKNLRNGGTYLDLRGGFFNQIGAEGVIGLADALKTNTVLTWLDLYYNQIGAEGARVLADALKTNTALTELGLSSNSIGAEGARVLADALKTNTALTGLDLSNNRIGDVGAKDIAEALKTNTALAELNLSWNSIWATVVVWEIGGYLQRNKEEQQEAYNQQLILAIKKNKIEKAKKLIFLINSNHFNTVDNKDNTALHYAVDKSLTELSMLLINKMSKEAISIGNIYNNTALHYATDNGLEEVSWFLINRMTQEALDMVNTDGNTALDYAIYNKLIITGFLAKKMSLKVVKTVNANCRADNLANIKDYESLEQYDKTREHEKVIDKCFPLPIKPQLPSLSLEGENTVAVGLAPVFLWLGAIYCFYTFCLKKNENQQTDTQVNMVNEIVYDNPLLNHPELLEAAMNKFSLKEIGELSTRLSPDLITQAISSGYNEGGELILSGLMSLEYNEAPTG